MGKVDDEIKKAIDGGYYVIKVQFDGDEEISRTKYNKPENFEISDWKAESLARVLLPSIRKCYTHEENRKKFEEWQKEQQEKSGT